jgi:hypothetical protein
VAQGLALPNGKLAARSSRAALSGRQFAAS